MSRPDVSVIIPTYNRKAYLREAIASCFNGNEDIDVGVVVVDDGSTDGTRAYLDALEEDRVRPIYQEHQGAQVARNHGMDFAQGEFVKFLDDDDELLPGALAQETDTLVRSGADIGCGDLHVRSPNREEVVEFEQESDPDIVSGIYKGSIWTHPHTFLYRNDALQECRWDPSIPYHQDTAFAIEAVTQGLSETMIGRPVALYYNHEEACISNNTKARASPVERAMLQIELIRQGLDRLRTRDLLESHHVEAAAEGMWRWAHIISAYDLSTFEDIYRKIQSLKPSFAPARERPLLSVLDTFIGAHRTEYVTYPLRSPE